MRRLHRGQRYIPQSSNLKNILKTTYGNILQGLCMAYQHCVCCSVNIVAGMPPKWKAPRGVARATASLTSVVSRVRTPPQALQHHPPPGRCSHGDSNVGDQNGASECHGGGKSSYTWHGWGDEGGPNRRWCQRPQRLCCHNVIIMAVTLAVGDAIASAASVTGNFTASVVLIDLHLSDKVMAQIWQDEYVDFLQLLPTNNQNDPMALSVQYQNIKMAVKMWS